MTFSPLINRTVPHHNKYNSRQGNPVIRVFQHHHAAVDLSGVNALVDPNAQKSANYIILSNGDILGQVPEEFRAWTTSGFENDKNAITFEVQNIGTAVNGNDNDPASWKVSDAAYTSIIRLLADIAKRYGWGAVSAGNYRGHREVAQTACPGGYLWGRMDRTRASANALVHGGVVSPPVAPATPPVANKSIWQLADEVLAGVHGSGEARKVSLGSKYDAVQAEVNRRSGIGPAAQVKSIAQLADEVISGKHGSGEARKVSLGNQYAAVQAEINRRLGVGGPSISQLADAVLAGKYGSGATRKAQLGRNYEAVQAEVNRRLGV
jgi:Negative regulator of beta-lactamase expression